MRKIHSGMIEPDLLEGMGVREVHMFWALYCDMLCEESQGRYKRACLLEYRYGLQILLLCETDEDCMVADFDRGRFVFDRRIHESPDTG